MSEFGAELPLDQISGLRPRVWISVGPGFNREDIKAVALNQGLGFTGDAITTMQAICVKVVASRKALFSSSNVLGPLARQEVLRILLAETRISSRMPELKR